MLPLTVPRLCAHPALQPLSAHSYQVAPRLAAAQPVPIAPVRRSAAHLDQFIVSKVRLIFPSFCPPFRLSAESHLECCGDGATCCGTSCCMSGFTCNSGVCQIQIVTTSATTRNTQGTLTNIFPTSDGLNGATPSQNGNADNERPNSTNNAAVIGGVVGGAVGGLALIGGCVAAWYYYSHGAAGAAGAAGHSGAAGDASTLGNAGASGAAQGYGWTTGAPGSPSVDQPLMTSTGMLITPAAASDAGFAAQQAYGAPGTPYLQPSTPWNGTDDTQPPLSQYPQSAYGAAAPPSNASGSAPWAGGQTYGQPGGFGAPGSLAPNNLGRSAYSGVATEVMQPGQGAHGGPGSK